jgi:hypothetical protein
MATHDATSTLSITISLTLAQQQQRRLRGPSGSTLYLQGSARGGPVALSLQK